MIDHKGDCNGQPCTCGAKAHTPAVEAVEFCGCGREDFHAAHSWLRLGYGWLVCEGVR